MAKKYDGPRPEEILCSEIVALMESGSTLPPWQRPWSGSKGPHRNLLTGAAYGGRIRSYLNSAAYCAATPSPCGWAKARPGRPDGCPEGQ
jgi:hypothetical protein